MKKLILVLSLAFPVAAFANLNCNSDRNEVRRAVKAALARSEDVPSNSVTLDTHLLHFSSIFRIEHELMKEIVGPNSLKSRQSKKLRQNCVTPVLDKLDFGWPQYGGSNVWYFVDITQDELVPCLCAESQN